MGVIKEGNGGRGKERRNGPWSDESISSGEKSNAALGRGGVSGEERGGREGGQWKDLPWCTYSTSEGV